MIHHVWPAAHLLLFLLTFPLLAHAADTTPDAVVAALYKQHEIETPFFQDKNRAALDRFFAKPLADEIWKDAKESQGEVRALDADPLFDSQDPNPKDFTVHPAKVTGDTATVLVTFLEGSRKVAFLFSLVKTSAGWRVSDIQYSRGGRTLLGILKAYKG